MTSMTSDLSMRSWDMQLTASISNLHIADHYITGIYMHMYTYNVHVYSVCVSLVVPCVCTYAYIFVYTCMYMYVCHGELYHQVWMESLAPSSLHSYKIRRNFSPSATPRCRLSACALCNYTLIQCLSFYPSLLPLPPSLVWPSSTSLCDWVQLHPPDHHCLCISSTTQPLCRESAQFDRNGTLHCQCSEVSDNLSVQSCALCVLHVFTLLWM